MKRCALYARVSTIEQAAKIELQTVALREYAARRDFQIVLDVTEQASGARDDRPRLKDLMKRARRREFDVVVVWKFDRFARSVHQLASALVEFQALGIDFVSVTEAIDTGTPAGRLVFGVIASVAEFERELIRERVTAGLRRAQARGVKLGRPTLHGDVVAHVRRLRAAGTPLRQIARELSISLGSAARYSAQAPGPRSS